MASRDAVIRAGLNDSDADVVQFAVIGIGRQQLSGFASAVVSLLKSDNQKLRMVSAQTLSMLGASAFLYVTELQQAADTESDPRVKQTLEGALLRVKGIRRE